MLIYIFTNANYNNRDNTDFLARMLTNIGVRPAILVYRVYPSFSAEEVAEHRISLQLEAVATTELGETQIAMAQVLMDGVPVPLVGSALLTEHDATAATVRAVLDALNRRLEQVL